VSADIAAFKAAGADQVLIKPVNAESLEAAFLKHGVLATSPVTARDKTCMRWSERQLSGI
jgi:ActR/RegA family two-component response regulator